MSRDSRGRRETRGGTGGETGGEGGISPAPERKSTTLLAVDTGGTFTDFLLFGDNGLTALKLPSTPDDPARSVLEGIERLLGERASRPPFQLVHGSTVATNALLERTGARVGLVTNAGFEDVIEIGRQDRPQLYALVGHRPPPLVARDDRIGVRGRVDAEGRELQPLDPEELEALPERLGGMEAVAVVLLHSYLDPEHEREVGRKLSDTGLPISLSSRILPEFREFERTSTTVVNAYVAPLMSGYLERIGEGSAASSIRIMGSAGGALPLARAGAEPVHTVLSGPAGGVMGALSWARRAGVERILSLDMGGTSTDVALVPGAPLLTREGTVAGSPVAVPLLDIHTVGAGGGSIAHLDPGGALRVGPRSAGADPGPIAYDRGGTEVTVTDANVWLGRLPSRGFLGGEGRLDREAIGGPLTRLADAAGQSPDDLAEGILEVVNTAMEGALRVISVERGMDPSEFHLVSFGGAAGLHAVELAERVGTPGVLIPPDPGLLSAFGMLVAPVVRDRARTVLLTSDDPDCERRIRSDLDELEGEARAEMVQEGADPEELRATRWVDARYRGQSYELRVPAEGWEAAFHDLHGERYGVVRGDRPVEAVTLRVRVEAPAPSLAGDSPCREGPAAFEPARVRWRGEEIEARLAWRSDLPTEESIPGPLVVLEYSSTTWCPPGWSAEVNGAGILRLSRGA